MVQSILVVGVMALLYMVFVLDLLDKLAKKKGKDEIPTLWFFGTFIPYAFICYLIIKSIWE